MQDNLNSEEQNFDRDSALKHLSNHIEMLDKNSIRGTVTVNEIWQEFERDRKKGYLILKRMMSEHHLRLEDHITSFEQSWQAWRKTCLVLIDQMKNPGAELRHFKEGKAGWSGYVLTVNGQPAYWLHNQSNSS
jgi:hypothetical protein